MDIIATIRSLQPFDLLVILGLAAMFVLGFMQGIVRRLLGIASILFSFFFAAQVREPFGEFLSENWTYLHPDYNAMIGFLATFLVASFGFTVAMQLFYRTVPLFAKYPVIDEILGGILGLVQGIVILAVLIMILDPFFEIPGIPTVGREFPFVRELHAAIDGSAVAGWFRETVIPVILAVFGFLIPDGVKAVFGG